jgi:hypothetical protein
MLRQFLGDEPVQDQIAQFAQLESRLTAAGLKPTEVLPLIAPLLNLPPGNYHGSRRFPIRLY